jgi:hypothetical protein
VLMLVFQRVRDETANFESVRNFVADLYHPRRVSEVVVERTPRSRTASIRAPSGTAARRKTRPVQIPPFVRQIGFSSVAGSE